MQRVIIPIDVDQAGLTWTAQLRDANGVNVGDPITTGFTAVANDYLFDYSGVPDSFTSGHVVFTADSGLVVESQVTALEAFTGGSGSYPVTWEQAKAHLRLTTDTDQSLVEFYIASATDYAEERLHSTLMETTRTAVFYDSTATVTLPYGPLIEVESVTDDNGTAITDYDVTRVGTSDRLTINAAFVPPLSVVYRAGYASADAIPASIRNAILCHVGTLYDNRESVTGKGRSPIPHTLDDFYRLKSRSVGVG